MDGKTDDEKPDGWLQYFNLHPRYVFPAISFIMGLFSDYTFTCCFHGAKTSTTTRLVKLCI